MTDTRNENAGSDKNGGKIWIVIGDIHGDTGRFTAIPELAQADGIIISGDLTNLGDPEAAQKVLNAIRQSGLPVWAQIGNMDKPEVNGLLNGQRCNLHVNVVELAPELAVFGVGGSTVTPFKTPSEFAEEDYAHWLNIEWEKASKYPHTVLISHNPPKNTACDDIGGNVHVGSAAVRQFIEEKQPDVCVCGHIHEGRAKTKIGKTEVLNPGTLAEGGYVLLKFHAGRLCAELCRIAD